MIKVLTIILLLFPISGVCQLDSFEISGHLAGSEDGDELYFLETKGNVRVKVGTIKIVNNTFKYKYHLKEIPNLVRLRNSKNRKRLSFWAENEVITINGDINNFDRISISGSKFAKKENLFLSKYHRDSSINHQLLTIEDHLNTPSSIYNLYRIYRKVPIEKLRGLYDNFENKWKAHDYGVTIGNYLKLSNTEIISVGDTIVDFTAKDKDGNTFQLSEEISNQSKLILLEFKNLYCQYSRKAIPEMEMLYDKYQDKIELITFIDDTRYFLWERYLKEDNTDWTKLWDGKGEIGETCVSYGVKGSPYYFIISQNGIIIDKWTGYEKGIIEEHVKKMIKK